MFSPVGTARNAEPSIQTGWLFFFLFLIFRLSSLLAPLKYFLPSFCSCVSCCLATFLYLVGQGRAPDRLQTSCQHHPLATRPGARDALQRAAHIASNLRIYRPSSAASLNSPPVTSGSGGIVDATVPTYLCTYSKAMADIQ